MNQSEILISQDRFLEARDLLDQAEEIKPRDSKRIVVNLRNQIAVLNISVIAIEEANKSIQNGKLLEAYEQLLKVRSKERGLRDKAQVLSADIRPQIVEQLINTVQTFRSSGRYQEAVDIINKSNVVIGEPKVLQNELKNYYH